MNHVQFQPSLSMVKFLEMYGTEEKCGAALIQWRWPGDFVGPRCAAKGSRSVFRRSNHTYWQCANCPTQSTVLAGTIFEHTKLPLSSWFLAMHLLTQVKNNVSALALKRHLGISYPSA